MRIYFGREPGCVFESLDVMLIGYLRANSWDWERSCKGMFFNLLHYKTYHTINPLILYYMDDEVAKRLVWIVDEHGEHIRMGDERVLQKLRKLLPTDSIFLASVIPNS